MAVVAVYGAAESNNNQTICSYRPSFVLRAADGGAMEETGES